MCLLVLASCSIKFKTATTNSRDYPDFVLGDFKYISADAYGDREWELRASEAKMYNASNNAYLNNIAMTFYNSDGSIKSFLSANSGYVDKTSMNVYAEGNVKILSENETTLETEKVYWDNTKRSFYSEPNSLVTVKRGNSILRGYKMTSDEALKEVVIENVQANVKK
jgi:LPS export ABC transporter protein LptC